MSEAATPYSAIDSEQERTWQALRDATAALATALRLTETQLLHLELFARSSFNSLDAEHVLGDLLAHRSLWQAFIFGRDGTGITLRDLPDGDHNADTLWILSDAEHIDTLAKLARAWDADEMNVLRGVEATRFLGGSHQRGVDAVLMLWWD